MTTSNVTTPVTPVKQIKQPKLKMFLRTDAGNAELFASLHENRVRYDHKRERWFVWWKHWWIEDSNETVVQWAKRAARLRVQCAGTLCEKEQKKEESWALHSESRSGLEATLRLARSEAPLADEGDSWDADPFLLGVANGVVNLRTGELRSGKPADKITLHSSVAFDPKASAPRWEQFLKEIFEDDLALIDYVHRAVGYSATGDVREQCLFLCYGIGANGKTTFLDVLNYAMGDYAGNLPFTALELKARSEIPNEIAGLRGRRFVTAIETNESARLNEARIKALTGCDPITARFLFREWFTFVPTAKLWLAFNNKPQVADDSKGFWRRPRIIPFIHQFGEKGEADPTLRSTLRAEAPGILAWIVRGCLKWQAEGLEAPERVKAATEAYREESNPLADYLAEKCILHSNAQVGVGPLYLDYRDWAQVNGEGTPLSRTAFSKCLQSLGLTNRRIGHERTWTWFGICRTIDASVQQLRVEV